MEIFHEKSNYPKGVSLILGFFDGVHIGHQQLLNKSPENKKVLVTFSSSPAEFFGNSFKYISFWRSSNNINNNLFNSNI